MDHDDHDDNIDNIDDNIDDYIYDIHDDIDLGCTDQSSMVRIVMTMMTMLKYWWSRFYGENNNESGEKLRRNIFTWIYLEFKPRWRTLREMW